MLVFGAVLMILAGVYWAIQSIVWLFPTKKIDRWIAVIASALLGMFFLLRGIGYLCGD